MKHTILLLFFLITTLSFSQITITGNVTDKQGEPIPGVNIIEKGTTNGVISDFNGNYEITVSSDTATLEVSFIGFEKKEVSVIGKTRINITLKEGQKYTYGKK